MDWLSNNIPMVVQLTGQHLWLALVPVVIGLVISIPLGWLANRNRYARGFLITLTGLFYTIPSLALIVILPIILGTQILDPLNVVVALTIYTVALLVRSVADALAAVPKISIAAATAMGYRPFRRFLGVEFPLSVPVVLAGVRVAAVSNISLVTVGALVGVGGLGQLFTEGFQRDNPPEIVTGIVVVLVLALFIDGLILLIGRLITPWDRVGTGAGRAA